MKVTQVYLSFLFRFSDDIEYMTGSKPNVFWKVCWMFITPAAMFTILVASIVLMSQGKASYYAWNKDQVRKLWCFAFVLLRWGRNTSARLGVHTTRRESRLTLRVACRPILACLREVCPPFISGRNRSLTARKDGSRGPAHNADTLNFSKLKETLRLMTPFLSLEVPQLHLGHAVLDNKKSFFFYT